MRQSVVLLILTLMIVVSFTKKATTSVKTFQVSEETIQVSLETGEMSEKNC